MDNIAAAATQTAAKEGTLVELAASLAISVETVARQQQEIKRLSKQVKALKKERDSGSQRRDISQRDECMHTL